MEENVKEKNTSTTGAPKDGKSRILTTDEKAQYEVFRNGQIPRDTIAEWIGNDLKAILSFVHGCLTDPDINKALIDAYYERYKKLHTKQTDNVEKTNS